MDITKNRYKIKENWQKKVLVSYKMENFNPKKTQMKKGFQFNEKN